MTEDGLWTLPQLCDQVAAALAEDYAGQRSGRVAELPNSRAIRWYTTIGLVDRPAATRGRTALYNRRHLLQLVAVKRLQAAGQPLADIQHQVAGATDTTLEQLAGLPAGNGLATPPARDGAFWTARPASGTENAADTVSTSVHGVRVSDSVTVLFAPGTRAPDAAELAAIQAAAAPLVDLIDQLGLRPGKETR